MLHFIAIVNLVFCKVPLLLLLLSISSKANPPERQHFFAVATKGINQISLPTYSISFMKDSSAQCPALRNLSLNKCTKFLKEEKTLLTN